MRDHEARGPIYRKTEVRSAHHKHHDEDVVIACFTFETYGLTQHSPIPLSIAAALKLYQQLGEVLASDVVSQYPDYLWEISNEVAKTTEKMARAKELYG